MDKINRIWFFDADWTLRKTKSGKTFPKNNKDWEPMSGMDMVLRDLIKNNEKIVIVSNQGGIESGYVTVEDVKEGFLHTMDGFEIKYPEQVDMHMPYEGLWHIPVFHNIDILFCSLMKSPFRKPNYASAEVMRVTYNLPDLSESYMVGDRLEDMEFANGANIGNFWFISDFVKFWPDIKVSESIA